MARRDEIYRGTDAAKWRAENPMATTSGVFGREPTLERLRSALNAGDHVLDLGCGGGYVTSQLADMVGAKGYVVGVDKSADQIKSARTDYASANLRFEVDDVTKPGDKPDSFDFVTSFMMIHNLKLHEISSVFEQTRRALVPGGSAYFLTMHPRALLAPELNSEGYGLVKYEPPQALQEFKRRSAHREGFEIEAWLYRCDPDQEPISGMMFHHERSNMWRAATNAGLLPVEEHHFWVDLMTAEKCFGTARVKTVPSEPQYWLFVLRKPN